MLFELLRITCQISLRLYISTFHGQLSHLHLDQKVRKFSKDQKVFKKQIDLANLGLCSVEGYWCFKLVFFKPYRWSALDKISNKSVICPK